MCSAKWVLLLLTQNWSAFSWKCLCSITSVSLQGFCLNLSICEDVWPKWFEYFFHHWSLSYFMMTPQPALPHASKAADFSSSWEEKLHGMKTFPHPSLFRSVVATEYPNEDASSSPQKMCCGTSRYTLSFFSSTTAPVWFARGAPATKVSSPRLIIPMAESTENPGRKRTQDEPKGGGRGRKRVRG